MVIHFVYKNEQGQLSVLAVFYHIGKHNRVLAKIFERFPEGTAGSSTDLRQPFNAANFLPKDYPRYYAFTGFLTTPPCSEG